MISCMKQCRYQTHVLLVVGVVLSICGLWPQVAAATYTVSPLVADLELEARGQANEVLTITNTTNRVQRVYATVNTVTLDADGGVEEFTQRSQSDNKVTPTSWFEVTRGRIEVPPQSQTEVPVAIRVHPQAEPGIYHVLVGIGAGSNRGQAEERVRTGQAPGTVFRVAIADDRTAYLQLRDFVADRLVSNVLTSNFSFVVENPSDTPLVPRGEIIVYDSRGRETTSFAVNEEGATIAPGDAQAFAIPMNEDMAWGSNRALIALTYGDGQRASLTDTIFFYRIPIPIVLTIFVLLLALSVLVAYVIHRRYDGQAVADDGADEVLVFHRPHQTRGETEHDIRIHTTHDKPNDTH